MATYDTDTVQLKPQLAGTRQNNLGNVQFEVVQEVDNTDSIEIFASSATKGKGVMEAPKMLQMGNVGDAALSVTLKVPVWTDDVTQSGSRFLQLIIPSGQTMLIPTTQIIDTASSATNDGTVVALSAPSSNLYIDSGVNLGAKLENDATSITTSADGTNAFRVGDLIQVGINATAATQIEILRVTEITSTTVMQVDRALFGTSAADGDSQTDATNGAVSGANIHFPFFNTIDDRNLGVKTDARGRFHSKNFFGLGRSTTIAESGILPGSVAFMFYTEPMQFLGLQDITASTDSGLVSGQTYYLKLTLDGGTVDELSFTVANTTFGGPNGILFKIQEVLNANFYDTTVNMFKKRVSVGIINGDIGFTYHSRTSTASIALSAGASGAANRNWFAQQNGRIPILASIRAALTPVLESSTLYDNKTYRAVPNKAKIMYDDGNGKLLGAGSGSINYETGEITFVGPPNADFKYAVAHKTGLGGRASITKGNIIENIYARSCSAYINTKIALRILG